MKLALTEKQLAIHNFLMETDGEKFTAYQIADTIGIDRKAINALVTGIAKKGYCVREEAQSTDANIVGHVDYKTTLKSYYQQDKKVIKEDINKNKLLEII